jgi:hypothetical protein
MTKKEYLLVVYIEELMGDPWPYMVSLKRSPKGRLSAYVSRHTTRDDAIIVAQRFAKVLKCDVIFRKRRVKC